MFDFLERCREARASLERRADSRLNQNSLDEIWNFASDRVVGLAGIREEWHHAHDLVVAVLDSMEKSSV